MSQCKVQVLYDLHIVGRDYDAEIAQWLHRSALKTRKPNGHRASLSRRLQCIQYILGVTAPAYRKHDIIRLDKILKLLRKNVLVTGVIRPCRHGWEIVAQR